VRAPVVPDNLKEPAKTAEYPANGSLTESLHAAVSLRASFC
jgi:hypothetical protein